MPLSLTSFLQAKYPAQIAQFIPHGAISSELVSVFIPQSDSIRAIHHQVFVSFRNHMEGRSSMQVLVQVDKGG